MERDQTDVTGTTGGGDEVDPHAGTTTGSTAGGSGAAATGAAGGSAAADTDAANADVVIVGVDVTGDDVPDIIGIDATGDGSPDIVIVDEALADADAGADRDDEDTGASDPVYDLVSVLYHALQGAETTVIYSDDAALEGDNELAEFFREVQEQDRARARRAKALLRRYLAEEE